MARPSGAGSTADFDVVIVGGGVMGCACAFRLASEGARVLVLERKTPGAEASSAAAGIVGALSEAHAPGPMLDLMLASRRLHPEWARKLEVLTSVDVGYREGGVLKVVLRDDETVDLVRSVAWQRMLPGGGEPVSPDQIRALEPLVAQPANGVLFPEDARIDPPSFLRALHAAAEREGAEFRSNASVARVSLDGDEARGVRLEDGSDVRAGAVVVAAGSWTALLGGLPLPPEAVVPARGQIVELQTPVPLLSRIVIGPRCYVVPRDDGRALVGSTLEFVGYEKGVTAGAVRDLLDAAIELVPSFAGARVRGAWSNFRPYTGDELPLLGEGSVKRLFFATGHYRTGILLTPITAESIVALVAQKEPPVPLSAFSPRRPMTRAR